MSEKELARQERRIKALEYELGKVQEDYNNEREKMLFWYNRTCTVAKKLGEKKKLVEVYEKELGKQIGGSDAVYIKEEDLKKITEGNRIWECMFVRGTVDFCESVVDSFDVEDYEEFVEFCNSKCEIRQKLKEYKREFKEAEM